MQRADDVRRKHASAAPGARRIALRAGLAAIGLIALSTPGCVALGWEFGPGMSSRSEALFSTPPVIVRRAGGYALSWSYGTAGFFFQPGYKALDGRLVFSLQGSSSSGSLAGRRVELAIEGVEELAALEHGGAFWWEPDGSLLELAVVDAAPAGAR